MLLCFIKQPSKDDLSKVQRISLTEAAQLEPNVCLAGVGGALVAPNEAMVDPWLLAMTHVWAAQEARAELRTSCEVVFVVVDPSRCLLLLLTQAHVYCQVVRCRRSGQIWSVTTLQGKEKTRVTIF